ncbi:MAG TPA: ATP-binding cassette domain-containing protein [Elusimicrobiota bacterium]|jgi:ABC-2 type transport system ATP-binding protein|nr:ATP-binding cassette domain-containing protein [Elusimicrobiota bacterium]
MAIIETAALRKEYGKLVAVRGLDLAIGKAEVFGLLGPNGAGKTTTIMMLATLVKPTSGRASVDGFDVGSQPAKVRQSLGMVFQEQTLDTLLTARENLELHARLYGVAPDLRRRRIEELLALVDLTERVDDQVKKYSGGMRRRLEIARGLLHRPAVLFLDEPTIGLDPQTRDRIWNYIKRVVREEGTTVVLTTHYMEEADLMCDRVGIIDHGRIVALDRPAVLKSAIGGAIVRLRAPGADLEALRRAPGVTKVEARGDWVEAALTEAHLRLPAVLAAVPGVESVEVHSPTLDDVFLKYTGRELRDARDEGESWMESMIRVSQEPR